MNTRGLLKLVLLLALANYASGLGAYVHERMEHWSESPTVATAKGFSAATDACDDDHHDADHCVVCQMLSSLRSLATSSSAAPVVAPAPSVELQRPPTLIRHTAPDCLICAPERAP